MIIDASNLILGRLASFAAKKALQGQDIVIVNCGKAVMTGRKQEILAKFKERRDRGRPTKGPFIHRGSDAIVRRSIRGMVGYKTGRGKVAFKRIKCFKTIPSQFQNEKRLTIKSASVDKLPNLRYVTVDFISNWLGGK
jgi:large subunit ribosomal protein L13